MVPSLNILKQQVRPLLVNTSGNAFPILARQALPIRDVLHLASQTLPPHVFHQWLMQLLALPPQLQGVAINNVAQQLAHHHVMPSLSSLVLAQHLKSLPMDELRVVMKKLKSKKGKSKNWHSEIPPSLPHSGASKNVGFINRVSPSIRNVVESLSNGLNNSRPFFKKSYKTLAFPVEKVVMTVAEGPRRIGRYVASQAKGLKMPTIDLKGKLTSMKESDRAKKVNDFFKKSLFKNPFKNSPPSP